MADDAGRGGPIRGSAPGQAARATCKSKAAISRAIASGRISAARDANGRYAIDPSELHRVYPVTVDATGATQRSATPNGPDATPLTEAVVLLLAEKDARIADQVEVIADLRRRLGCAAARPSPVVAAVASGLASLPQLSHPSRGWRANISSFGKLG